MCYFRIFSNCLVVVCLTCLQACNRQQVSDPAVDGRLSQLLENKDFFGLREELAQAKGQLSPDRWLFYQVYCNQAFGQDEESNAQIRTLFDTYARLLNDTIKRDLLSLQAQNYSRTYQYAEAADSYLQLINEYAAVTDSSTLESYRNVFKLWNPIRDVPPQQVHKTKDTKILLSKDGENYRIPVTSGGVTEELIFDTGANLSMVSHSIAEQMGLRIYDTDIQVGSSTSIQLRSSLGIADSLWLGDHLLVENVVFLVMPDEVLYIAPIDFHIKGTIGFPVIYQMDEIHLYNKSELGIPAKSGNRELNNLFLDHFMPVAKVCSGNESLMFTLDTGASRTELVGKYYEEHEEYLKENAELTEEPRGGVGGIEYMRLYRMTDFPYTLGSQTGLLPEIHVRMDRYSFNNHYDGNLGQDILGKYDKLILNFREMYIDLE